MSPTAQKLLDLVRRHGRRLALRMEHLWAAQQSSPDQGLAIGPGEVARLLAPRPAEEAAFFATGPGRELDLWAAEAAATLAADPGWRRILGCFGLDDAEADLLALLIAVELDPGLGRVVAYLHDDGRLTQPTPWLAAKLAGRDPAPFNGAGLRRWLLAAPLDNAGPARLLTAWQADAAPVDAVFSGIWDDPALRRAVRRSEPAEVASLPRLHEDAFATLAGFGDPRDVELVGVPGIGRQTLAARFAAGQSLLAADLPALVATGLAPGHAITRVLRQAAMTGALAYFRDADTVTTADWANARALDVRYLRGVRHPTGDPTPIMLAPLPIATRLGLWRYATAAAPPPGLAATRLTPAEIIRAAALPPGTPLKQRGSRPDHALLSRLPTPYRWDDLVLPADITAQLRAFESQVKLRWTVYEDWGFARLTHLGHGISALFGGPSGTGKTMAAQVLARALGLDLLRVDLAGVVNKYIGETEKKLREVFDACEDSGALLFFDEADALFGNRTQVKDAHDRFANIEIDYLLQRLEQFDGVAILATNRRQDLDAAFVRRLRFVVEFLPPRPDERLALWRRALLPAAPNGEPLLDEIDWRYLSEKLTMTGAEIKSTALGAAFIARGEGSRIAMRHLLTAAQRELAKQGLRLRVGLREAGE